MPQLPPGRFPILSPRDFERENVDYPIEATGPIRVTNTKFGARLLVEVELAIRPGTAARRREFFVNFQSASYVRLCDRFGDDVTKWRGLFAVRVIRDRADARPRVEVQR